MGHEFVELKNSHAAIEAYRKAVGGFGALLSCTMQRSDATSTSCVCMTG